MTSNLGSEYILENKNEAKELVMNELRHTFKPEFLNRIDEIILFNSLEKGIVYDILNKIISEIEQRLSDKKIKIVLDEKAKDYIIESAYDERYGARPIKRFVSRHLETLIAKNIIASQIHFGETIRVSANKENLILEGK